jgi:hypothetical protein
MPNYRGGDQSPAGYVFGVYDIGAGDPGNLSNFDLEMNGFTTTDAQAQAAAGNNRRLRAAWLGNVLLGQTLSVFVGDGPPLTAAELAGNGGANSRTWYDGIAIGDVQNLEPLACIPEPASLALLSIVGLIGVGLVRRRA